MTVKISFLELNLMNMWVGFHQTCIDTLFGGGKDNKILTAFTLLWSHKLFPHAFSLIKYYSFNIASF